jgi:hypothetical protein
LVGFSIGIGLEAKLKLWCPGNSLRKCLSSLISILNNEQNYVERKWFVLDPTSEEKGKVYGKMRIKLG